MTGDGDRLANRRFLQQIGDPAAQDFGQVHQFRVVHATETGLDPGEGPPADVPANGLTAGGKRRAEVMAQLN